MVRASLPNESIEVDGAPQIVLHDFGCIRVMLSAIAYGIAS